MSGSPKPAWRFVSFPETEVERLPGKIHHWYCKPGMVADTNLMEVYVSYLRRKIGSGRIETIRSLGYRLVDPDA